MWIIKNRAYFYAFSALMFIASIGAMATYKWNIGIEFTGGTLTEVRYKTLPNTDDVRSALEKAGFVGAQVQTSGTDSLIVRTQSIDDANATDASQKDISSAKRAELMTILAVGKDGSELIRSTDIGPTVGGELKSKSMWAILVVILAIVAYIGYAFREVSKPVPSWAYGAVVVVALLHDVIIPAGAYIFFGHTHMDAQVDVLFVTAILTVLGYSVHDSIVVFDRTRENLKDHARTSFDHNVGNAVMQTMGRSINTSLTVVVVSVCLWLLGGVTTKYFAMVISMGVLIGTYSSVFIGSPLLVTVANYLARNKKEGEDA